MSTKIYNAFRIKKGVSIWPLMWWIRDRAEANAVAALRAHYWDLVRKMDTESLSYKTERAKDKKLSEISLRTKLATDTVRKGYQTDVTKSTRELYSLDVTIALYPHKSRYYIRTFCESISVFGKVLDFVEEMPELEDFHYQNQTDPPEDVSPQAWLARKRIWDQITKYKGIGSHVTLDVVCWSNFYKIDPWLNLLQEWKKQPPVLPIREEIWAEELRKLNRFKSVTALPGCIVAKPGVSIIKKGAWWVSTIRGERKNHRSLNRAADHVHFEHLPQSTKDMILGFIERSKERQVALKKLASDISKAKERRARK